MVAPPREARWEEPTLLITDDDEVWRETLNDVLMPEGYHTHLASCGEEAIEIVREETIDVVLLDFHMPTIDGLETVKLVHEIDELLPCILLTADTTIQDHQPQEVLLELWAVLHKPFQKQALIRAVAEAVLLGRDEEIRDPGRN